MPIKEHPPAGTILICDFETDFKLPEMVKIRPVVVVSPICRTPRPVYWVFHHQLEPKLSFHEEISIDPRLPHPWDAKSVWIRAIWYMRSGFTG